MDNRYQAPASNLNQVGMVENNSGRNEDYVPEEVKGWCWGGFLLTLFWAIGNRVWIGLLCLVPYIGFAVGIYMGVKGRELAWKKKRWESIEHFNEVQRKWSFWGVVITVIAIVGIALLIASDGGV